MPRSITVEATPLPPTNETLKLATRPMKLNDYVKDAIMDGAYELILPYIQSVNPREGATGSVRTDRVVAALTLQTFGKERNIPALENANLVELDHAINVALRAIRDESGNRIDRKSRRLIASSRATTPGE
jgi:hypothetical protein